MIIPERLVDRIHAAGLSYTAVANRVGVKQPTITRLARGDQQRTTRLPEIARVLHTTPAYLEGKTNDPDEGATTGQLLSSDEAEWVELYGGLTPEQREAVRTIVRGIVGYKTPTRRNSRQQSDLSADN